jgi:hypothetical protein
MKKIFFFALMILTFFSCVKEDFFGRSDMKKIFYFSLPQQAGNTEIKEDSLIIRISVAPGADLTKLYLDSVQLSSYARISPTVKSIQDFSVPVKYTVTAENGSIAEYTVFVRKEGSTPQLENGSLDEWYTPSGKNYLEPGANESTIWASGNAGVVTLGQANVLPVVISGSDRAAELITRDLGSLAGLVGQRMAAGSIFTGKFILDVANPLNSTKFGVPFIGKPKGFTIAYKYVPGAVYKNGTGQTLSKSDSCDIYMLLENRSGSTIKRIATGWFRTGAAQISFTDITVNLIYGPLPSSSPVYMFPASGGFGNATDEVTHISFIASSSAYGASFEGGVESKLTLNNLRLIY